MLRIDPTEIIGKDMSSLTEPTEQGELAPRPIPLRAPRTLPRPAARLVARPVARVPNY